MRTISLTLIAGLLISESAMADATSCSPEPKITPAAATKEAPFVNSLGMKFVPAGTEGVLFCVWETRVKDYAAFAAATKHTVQHPPFAQTGEHPAVCISWDDAAAFCQWLSQKENRVYRLPTDAEWSTAVGLPKENGATPKEKNSKIKDMWPWGTKWPPPKGASNLGDDSAKMLHPKWTIVAGYDDAFAETAPVGSFTANRFGLYDLSGNAWEWCDDWYDETHKTHVERGGSYFNSGRDMLLSSFRDGREPTLRLDGNGFRVVVAGASSGR